ncbi:ARS binding protein 2-domain-containing protein [Neohortaea acidophila]|uniref:ARS binding protein 2-domain-containing protein n=1 Tax=Neohortaea acidophila TaxID=245834 RepID=A0A6A6PHR1_9PEZI|nr:ARS binding protein 2-domain-containing protein [Neohortaea acidophila]KAF2478807.1 ARS binding protein 2-domain-containing protein [Neohortaea acidophila]
MNRMANHALSPGLDSASPNQTGAFTPMDRSLPSRKVTSETLTDAYVAFILYCNPSFALDVDTETLRNNFESPPRSDNKDFETFRLYELIRQFDAKEIKTWAQLALDLGVEAPDTAKGQSVQKVQQYTVRLKRWMRAMHVDAFFEYLLGKEHSYFTDVPPPADPHPPNGRDGVVAEEDLAIRALDPSFRPKRGRRRNSDVEQDGAAGSAVGHKQARLMDHDSNALVASPHPMNMGPYSAHPSNSHDPWAVASAVTPQTFAPWANRSAVPHSAATSSQFRWHVNDASQNPLTPHPMTAHPTTYTSERFDTSLENEPKTAITLSTRKRKKHGPAVSSAWPSANGPGAKPRGRPPASRNVQDGPFTTFPADPVNDRTLEPAFTAPVASMDPCPAFDERSPMSANRPVSATGETLSRPGRLSLQVPPHTGGPVRLATPPRVLVNGETNEVNANTGRAAVSKERREAPTVIDRAIPGFSYEVLRRTLTSVLLRADLTGRRARLSGDEAKRLADSVLERFNIPRTDTDVSRDDIARLTAASWLGMGEHLNVPLGPAAGHNQKITVARFRTDDEGYEQLVSADEDDATEIRSVFDFSWTATTGGCTGTFELRGLSLSPPAAPQGLDIHDQVLETFSETARRIGMDSSAAQRMRSRMEESGVSKLSDPSSIGADGIDWKIRAKALEFGANIAKGEFERFRDRVIERLLDDLLGFSNDRMS